MKTLYLVRHGQSLANTGAKSMPDADIPLTELGLQQAKDLLARWQNQQPTPITPSHIYHSELLRAKQTAQVFVDGFNMDTADVATLASLNEFRCLGYSTVAGMMGAERAVLAKEYWSSADVAYKDSHDSDSFANFLSRVDDFITSLNDGHDTNYANNSLFFGHGIWIGLLVWRLLGCPVKTNADIQKFRRFQTALPMYNTVVYRLTVSDDGIKQLEWFNF